MSDVTETSVPKLINFGLAKNIGQYETVTSRKPFGTLEYAAPEVLK